MDEEGGGTRSSVSTMDEDCCILLLSFYTWRPSLLFYFWVHWRQIIGAVSFFLSAIINIINIITDSLVGSYHILLVDTHSNSSFYMCGGVWVCNYWLKKYILCNDYVFAVTCTSTILLMTNQQVAQLPFIQLKRR